MPSDLEFCPNCGGRNDPGAQFCGHCGTAMDQIVPGPPVAGPSVQPVPRRRGPWWLLLLVAVIVVANFAIFASGHGAEILGTLKRAMSPSRAPQPTAPASPPATSQPVTPAPPPPAAQPGTPQAPPLGSRPVTPPAPPLGPQPVTPPSPPPAAQPVPPVPPPPPAVPRLAVTKFALTSFTAGSAAPGLRVKMSGTFLLAGAPPQTVAKVVPVWVVRGGQRQYGTAATLPVKDGPVKVSATALIPRVAPSDHIDCSLAVQIAGQEFLSPAKGFAVASVLPASPPAAQRPAPAAPPPTASPVPPPAPAPSPPATSPSQPVPSLPAAPPGSSVAASVADLKLTPTSSLTVAPPGTVSFNLSFNLTGSQQTTVESMIGWRSVDGTLHYGKPQVIPAVPGTNTYRGSFNVTADTAPGTTIPVYGVVKLGDRFFQTPAPMRITVAGVPRPAPPAGEAPPSQQPPSAPLAPPRFARSAICGFWHSDYGDVTFKCPAAMDEGPVHITGTWRQGPGKWGTITGGTFDRSTGAVTFNYYEPWIDASGAARFTLDPTGTRLTGTWQQSNGAGGAWTMWR